ncbi:MAG: hypothetical protein HZB72_00900 [Burkholderiales bacterium]|nr:hypothetical protein [Burkholderiales bacterium]
MSTTSKTEEPDHGFRPSLLADDEPAGAGAPEAARILSTVQTRGRPARGGRKPRPGRRASWPGWVFGSVAVMAAGAMLWGLWQAAARPAPTRLAVRPPVGASSAAAAGSARVADPAAAGASAAVAQAPAVASGVVASAHEAAVTQQTAQAQGQAGPNEAAGQTLPLASTAPTDPSFTAPSPTAPFALLDGAPQAATVAAAAATTQDRAPHMASSAPAARSGKAAGQASAKAGSKPAVGPASTKASKGTKAVSKDAGNRSTAPAARPPAASERLATRKADPDVELLEAVMRHSPRLPRAARAASAP